MLEALRLDLESVSPREEADILARLLRPDFDDWSEQAARIGYCHHPVRLTGQSLTVDKTTGAVLTAFRSADLPDEVAYVRCGNRRASVCPPCAREYAGDMWHLLRAGAAGGDKGVPATVSDHPMVFATVTAPSFGPVHTAKRPGSKGPEQCRPRSRGETCPHGRSLSCMRTHKDGDPLLGQPLCRDCYDYEAHVIWQWWAPKLWSRLTTALFRLIARALGLSDAKARELVRVSFAKVAEYQLRGVIHFHAIIRLDGKATDDDPFPTPQAGGDSDWLAEKVREATAHVSFDAPPVTPDGPTYRLRFGAQVDARPIHKTRPSDHLDGAIHPETVAAYIAKYATKSASDLEPSTAELNPHLARIRTTVKRLDFAARSHADPRDDEPGDYALLGKWAHMLGFRGHFASKSRRYSTTMGALREARKRFQRLRATNPNGVVDTTTLDPETEEDETSLVVNQWSFAGMGWLTCGDAALAEQAAASAREYDRIKREKPGSNTSKTREAS